MAQTTQTSASTAGGSPDPSGSNPHRLPRTVIPRRYDLTLEPDLDQATFSGTVVVAADVAEPTATVVLNALELEVDEAWVAPEGGEQIDADVALDPGTERATLTLPRRLQEGSVTVHLRFRGILNDKLKGFYRSAFTDDEGRSRVLATTQMEATHARQAFPCWDEPDFKAVFGVTLVVPEGLMAVSNTSEVSRRSTGDGRVAVSFADTISMSTYLVAFVVGPLEATDPIDVDGTPLRIIHPPNRGHLTAFALDAAAFSLRWFADWFGIPYPGDKLDLVAIPDFAFGAMENLGCVTFRERLLLIDPQSATKDELQAVVDVIAHELAHMWFGDLVTMKWWNGIWLNEAFATFMEMLACDAYRPDWERWVFFGRERTGAFDTDSLSHTRPIEFPVVSPDDAEGMFDVLTYQKGSAVVRMLQQYLGPDRFRAGIQRYMQRHAYGNTETSDLWDALEDETGEPVRRIAESWIFQGGFPQVTVDLDLDANGAGTGDAIRLAQARFRYAAGAASGGGTATSESRWAVPLVVETQANGNVEKHRVLLDSDTATLELASGIERVNANAGANGFYRVTYSPELRDKLVAARAELAPLERYALVDDAWAAVLSGSSAAVTFLELAEQLADETDLYVWQLLLGGLSSLERLVEGEIRDQYAGRVRGLLGPVTAQVGADPRPDDDDRTLSLRASLLGTAAVVGDDPDARARSQDLAERYLADPAAVEANLGTTALGVAAIFGDTSLHERLEKAFRQATTPQQRERALHAFGAFRDPAALSRTLELSLSGAIRSQDAPYVIREALTSRGNSEMVWDFVTSKWDHVNEVFPSNSIARMLGGVRSFRGRSLARTVTAFLDDHTVPQGEQQVRQHVERMWVSVALMEREATRFPAALTH